MKTKPITALKGVSAALLLSVLSYGCATDYAWKSSVPAEMRTVSVPTFRNESELTELGSLMTGQLLREFQREGTFAIRRPGSAALEIQGIVKSASSSVSAYDRRTQLRLSSHDFKSTVLVSVIDKKRGKVIIDNRPYVVRTSFTAGNDLTTAQRDASRRLADELARAVVDDVLSVKF